MTQIKFLLNAKENRELFDPQGSFARTYKTAAALLQSLRMNEFHICKVIPGTHHVAIKLGCGATLSVYTASGKVMAQGKLTGCGSHEAMQMLKKMLPENTIWQLQIE